MDISLNQTQESSVPLRYHLSFSVLTQDKTWQYTICMRYKSIIIMSYVLFFAEFYQNSHFSEIASMLEVCFNIKGDNMMMSSIGTRYIYITYLLLWFHGLRVIKGMTLYDQLNA